MCCFHYHYAETEVPLGKLHGDRRAFKCHRAPHLNFGVKAGCNCCSCPTTPSPVCHYSCSKPVWPSSAFAWSSSWRQVLKTPQDTQEFPPEDEEELFHCVQWPHTGRDCPERFWSFPHWRYPRTVWMQLCALGWPYLIRKAGSDDALCSLPTWPIQWLCDFCPLIPWQNPYNSSADTNSPRETLQVSFFHAVPLICMRSCYSPVNWAEQREII